MKSIESDKAKKEPRRRAASQPGAVSAEEPSLATDRTSRGEDTFNNRLSEKLSGRETIARSETFEDRFKKKLLCNPPSISTTKKDGSSEKGFRPEGASSVINDTSASRRGDTFNDRLNKKLSGGEPSDNFKESTHADPLPVPAPGMGDTFDDRLKKKLSDVTPSKSRDVKGDGQGQMSYEDRLNSKLSKSKAGGRNDEDFSESSFNDRLNKKLSDSSDAHHNTFGDRLIKKDSDSSDVNLNSFDDRLNKKLPASSDARSNHQEQKKHPPSTMMSSFEDRMAEKLAGESALGMNPTRSSEHRDFSDEDTIMSRDTVHSMLSRFNTRILNSAESQLGHGNNVSSRESRSVSGTSISDLVAINEGAVPFNNCAVGEDGPIMTSGHLDEELGDSYDMDIESGDSNSEASEIDQQTPNLHPAAEIQDVKPEELGEVPVEAYIVEEERNEYEQAPVYIAAQVEERPWWKQKYVYVGVVSVLFGAMVATIGALVVGQGGNNEAPEGGVEVGPLPAVVSAWSLIALDNIFVFSSIYSNFHSPNFQPLPTQSPVSQPEAGQGLFVSQNNVPGDGGTKLETSSVSE